MRFQRPSLVLLLPLGLVLACNSFSPLGLRRGENEGQSERLNHFLEEVFLTRLDRSPELQSRLGIDGAQGRWDDLSDTHAIENQQLLTRDLRRLRSAFDLQGLDVQGNLSYRVFEYAAELDLAEFEWRLHDYPINQMHGIHAETPAFLINAHGVDEESDLKAYIARLQGIRRRFEVLEAELRRREELGVLPPRFVFTRSIEDCRNLLHGKPFDTSDQDSVWLEDFAAKLAGLEGLTTKRSQELHQQAVSALQQAVRPAYESLIRTLEEQQQRATDEAGVWKLPRGDEYYQYCLKRATTTELGPDEIHELGLSEVDRIQNEMREIMNGLAFAGDLPEFFDYLRTASRFTFSNDDAGRRAYLAQANEIIAAIRVRLPELFITLPKADLVVKRVESYRERSAGKAFYERGTPDGRRNGTYYANLYDMRDMPIYQMEALAYHEAIPGHHMQISIAQELQDLPRFRRFGGFTAYVEGWALYCELLPKELGFYEDPYSDFGRLAMELWRACRLVVDTGIHHKRWTREEAIDYLKRNTPNSEGDCTKAIERYIVMPGQATAYKIGMLKILELRQRAQRMVDERFDLRAFHDRILRSGPLPLTVLETVVNEWIEERNAM